MSETRRNPDELGALWLKSGAKGEYMTGDVTIDGVRVPIVCFRVERGGERAPTWRILKSKPREAQAEPVTASDVSF